MSDNRESERHEIIQRLLICDLTAAQAGVLLKKLSPLRPVPDLPTYEPCEGCKAFLSEQQIIRYSDEYNRTEAEFERWTSRTRNWTKIVDDWQNLPIGKPPYPHKPPILCDSCYVKENEQKELWRKLWNNRSPVEKGLDFLNGRAGPDGRVTCAVAVVGIAFSVIAIVLVATLVLSTQMQS